MGCGLQRAGGHKAAAKDHQAADGDQRRVTETAKGDLYPCEAAVALKGEKVESQRQKTDEDEAHDLDPYPPLSKQDEHRDGQRDRCCCVRCWHLPLDRRGGSLAALVGFIR